ncbi:MAG: PD-(D/E)XK nuclease family protein [Actinomycetota bacterium]|nr:PD-(D/E)XK nuclease family protein [Actinomycetota bacterium]
MLKHRSCERNLRLSSSSIAVYQNCPLSYKFQFIDKLPTKKTPLRSFGSSVHAALAHFYNVPIPKPPTLDELLKLLSKVWEPEGYKDRSEESIYFEHAREILTNFYYSNVKDFRIPAALEHKFQIELDGEGLEKFTLSGVIDRMDKLPEGGYEIIDYKTSRRLPPRSKVESDLQLSIYHLAAQKIWGIEPEKLTLYFLIPNEKISTSRTREDVEETKDIMRQVVKAIKLGEFEPRENTLCPWCDFQAHCPLRKHKFLKGDGGSLGVCSPSRGMQEAAIEVEKVVDEYAELKRKLKEINLKLDELQEIIHDYCEKHGLSRLYSDKVAISRKPRLIQSYNIDKLRKVLEPLGLWERILRVDGRALKELLNSDDIKEEVKGLIESAKEVEDITYALYVREIQREPDWSMIDRS